MKGFIVLLVFVLECCLMVEMATVSQNCLWGKTSAAKCCKNIPNGDSTYLANPQECTLCYICRNNKPVSYQCSPGQNWDFPDQKCLDAAPNVCDQIA